MTATEKTIAACFVLHCADGVAFSGNRVYSKDGRIMRRTRAAARDERIVFTNEFSFDKKIAEGRMRNVGGRGCQHDFSITCHFDFPHARRAIGQRHATHFGVVFRRHNDVCLRLDARVQPLEDGALFRKCHFITLRRAGGWLITG